MKTLRSLALALVAVLGITGCLQVEKVVKVKPDGSGTIEETVIIGKAFLDQMTAMTSALGGGKSKDPAGAAPGFQLIDEAKLQAAAARMGDGVTFVSAKPLKTEKGDGFVAIYAFTDINQVKLNKDFNDAVPQPPGKGVTIKPSGDQNEPPVTFTFVKGTPSVLTVSLPPPDLAAKKAEKKDEPAPPPGGDDMAMMMMKEMFKDMKMTVALEVEGKIAETDAKYVDGSRVTFVEMDFNQVLANPEKFKAMAKAQPKSLQDAEALLKGVEGIKIETQPKVTVKFQ